MENNPFGSSSFEAPEGGDSKSSKESKKDKKKAAAEKPAERKKEQASRDIARSIEAGSVFAPLEKSEKPEGESQSAAEPESTNEAQTVEELSQEEITHIQQETAQEHLDAIEQGGEQVVAELEPATEFLERVAAGEDPEAAFVEVATAEGSSEAEVAEMLQDLTDYAAENENEDEVEPEAMPQDENADGIINPAEQHEGVVDWRANQSAASPPRPPHQTQGATSPQPPIPAASPASVTMPAAATEYYRKRHDAGDLLLIGFVGYLIGRRRGRVRAEKRLLPVQKKLEKQVTKLEDDITRKEQQLVAIRAEKNPVTVQHIARPERAQPGLTETRIGMEKPVRAERLGRMVVTAEAPPKAKSGEKPSKVGESLTRDYVQTMPRAELLEVSAKIIVEGASLRKIYESNLVGEKQLRHLVAEHLQGKDIRKDLRREMVEHEIDFERDPQLRDRVRSQLASDDPSTGLGEMLAKAGVTGEGVDSQLERHMQKDAALYEAQTRKALRRRAVADTGMITAIVLLAAIVAFLLLK